MGIVDDVSKCRDYTKMRYTKLYNQNFYYFCLRNK